MKKAARCHLLVYVILLSALSGRSLAGEAAIPYSFTAGTKARAEDMNANFSAVKTAVDDNNARINQNTTDLDSLLPGLTQQLNALTEQVATLQSKLAEQKIVYVTANGQSIGTLIGVSDEGSGISDYIALSSTEYAFRVDSGSGHLRDSLFYYTSEDCTGPVYILAYTETHRNEPQGAVIGEPPGSGLGPYYVPRGTSTMEVSPVSYLMGGESCVAAGFQGTTFVYMALPNDQQVTGVPNTPFELPVRAELR